MPPEGRIRILCVDDSSEDLELITLALARQGGEAEVVCARSGDEAIETMRSDRPDLVLLDLKMPRLDGHAVLGRSRLDPSLETLPIVVLSSSDDPEDRQRAYRSGARGYLVKPEDFSGYRDLAAGLWGFWVRLNRYPPG